MKQQKYTATDAAYIASAFNFIVTVEIIKLETNILAPISCDYLREQPVHENNY